MATGGERASGRKAIVVVGLIVALVTQPVLCQSNNNPIIPGSFYMDSSADCNGPVREIYGQSVRVIGHGAIQEQLGPQSCSLILRSQANFEQTHLRLQIVAATIKDCNVRFTLYDGDPGQGTLQGYDCGSVNKPNQRDFVTTGDTVSFILERRDSTNTLYDIEVFVTPIVSGDKPGPENNNGEDWGLFREKLHNDAAIGIVGAVFLVGIILVCLGIFLCYCRYKGMNKPWEQHQLSTFRPTNSIYETKSKFSEVSSGVHPNNASVAARSQVASEPRHRVEPARHMARPSEDEDSVFDDSSDVPPKKQLMEQDRRWERERERARRERERLRQHGRSFASQNNSYVQADDDHPQDTFVERIIEPRVKSQRRHKPPTYDEAVHETETEKSDLSESEEEQSSSKEEEESQEEEEESEEQSEEEEDEDDGPPVARPKPVSRNAPQQPMSQPQQVAMPPPGMQPYPGYPPMGYPVGYPMPPGQFVPIMTAPGQPFMGPGHAPPRYQGERPPAQSAIRPTDPPVYSYLVQRGYRPLDLDHPSSANTSRSQGSLEELDRNAAASGVEYMKR